MMNALRAISLCLLALAPCAASGQAAAGYPSRPVTLIVPFPAGGTTLGISMRAVSDDRRAARSLLSAAQAFLRDRLRLELNPRRVVLAPISRPRDVLGYVRHPGDRMRLRRRTARRLWRRLPRLAADAASGRRSSSCWRSA